MKFFFAAVVAMLFFAGVVVGRLAKEKEFEQERQALTQKVGKFEREIDRSKRKVDGLQEERHMLQQLVRDTLPGDPSEVYLSWACDRNALVRSMAGFSADVTVWAEETCAGWKK